MAKKCLGTMLLMTALIIMLGHNCIPHHHHAFKEKEAHHSHHHHSHHHHGHSHHEEPETPPTDWSHFFSFLQHGTVDWVHFSVDFNLNREPANAQPSSPLQSSERITALRFPAQQGNAPPINASPHQVIQYKDCPLRAPPVFIV